MELGLEFKSVAGVEILHSKQLRKVNPMGKVPAVLRDDGRVISESGAILYHFARGTPLWPEGEDSRTEVLRWMFFEQNLHEPNIATSRYWLHLSGRPQERAAVLPLWHDNGVAVLETATARSTVTGAVVISESVAVKVATPPASATLVSAAKSTVGGSSSSMIVVVCC